MIKFHKPDITNKEINAMNKVMRSGWLGEGKQTEKFATRLAEMFDVKYAIPLNSCTAGLYYAGKCLNRGGFIMGDSVIVPALTFAATANAVEMAGMRVMFADINRNTLNMHTDNMENIIELDEKDYITHSPNIIIPVHFAGKPCYMDSIMHYAQANHMTVIEDCAHAFGAKWKDKYVGTFGKVGVFSFHATKNITTGVGGVLITNYKYIAQYIFSMINHGRQWSNLGNNDYSIVNAGLEDYMTDINAAIGLEQLKRYKTIQKKRERLWKIYYNGFIGNSNIDMPLPVKDGTHSYHRFVIMPRFEYYPFTRDEFIVMLLNKGIECKVHYKPLHLEPYYHKKYGYKKGDFPNAEWAYERIVGLPLHTKMSITDAKYIVQVIKDLLDKEG